MDISIVIGSTEKGTDRLVFLCVLKYKAITPLPIPPEGWNWIFLFHFSLSEMKFHNSILSTQFNDITYLSWIEYFHICSYQVAIKSSFEESCTWTWFRIHLHFSSCSKYLTSFITENSCGGSLKENKEMNYKCAI